MKTLDAYYKSQITYPLRREDRFSGSGPSQLYIFLNLITGLYKIGITSDIERRRRDLINASGCLIETVAYMKSEPNYDEPPRCVERLLHTYYGNERDYGEWFSLRDEDVEDILDLIEFHISPYEYWFLKYEMEEE
jgi:hypothetical protein